MPSSQLYGTTSVFGGEVPVAGIAGDQQAALFGQACQQPGETKNTYGTGSFVLLNTGTEAPEPGEGLLTTVAWGLGEQVDYALEAAVFVTGAAVQWLRDGLGIISEAAESEPLAASLDSNDDVYFVPALTGLGSPHWDPYARGTIVGLTRGTGRAHLARAALESIAYQTVDAVRAQEAASGESVPSLKADGGAVVNAWLMQFQADVLGGPGDRPRGRRDDRTRSRVSCRDRNWASGPPQQVREMWREAAPLRAADARRAEREELLGRWHEALARSRGWSSGVTRAARRVCEENMAEVSPKDMKPQVYKDPRPAEMFTKFHRSARRGVGWIYDFVRVILTLPTILIYRARAIGVENVPRHRAGDPRPRTTSASGTTSSPRSTCGGRSSSWRSPSSSRIRRSSTSSSTAASFPCGVGITTRRRSSPPTRSSIAAARC